jgi:MHS family proline/betaine transporter-like MFS transporter
MLKSLKLIGKLDARQNMTDKSLLKVVIPGLAGNVLEWYDFALYGYFASIMSPLFFPVGDKTWSLIASFAVFAIGFIMRPVGAIIFGHLGDKFGRKNSLAAAILLMAIPTMLMGCLPSYQSIGIAAPILLIIFRLLQGLAVGGEFTGSIVYILEHAPKNQRGFFGSLSMSSAFLGLLIGSLAATVVSYFGASWAWRVPFLLSIILGAIGLYLRMGMPESPIFERIKKQGEVIKHPFILTFKHYKLQMLIAIAIVLLPATGFYLSFVYLATYLNHFFDINLHHAMLVNTVTMSVVIIIGPLFGIIADRITPKQVIKTGACAFLCLSIPLYILLSEADTEEIVLAQSLFALLVAMSYAAVPAALAELFPANIRFTGISFPYNIANALFGGTAPLIATSGIKITNLLIFPGIYLSILSLITFYAAFKMEDKPEVEFL